MKLFLVLLMLALMGATLPAQAYAAAPKTAAGVPFYSQFADITSPKWQKVGCGVASLAMVIDYYAPASVSVDKVLAQALAAGAYTSAGWSYAGLIQVAKEHGMQGAAYDLSSLSTPSAYSQLASAVKSGPVIVSVHYKFDPKSTIPHLVVIDSIQGATLYYNDPAAKGSENALSSSTFTKAWKKRYIVIRPDTTAKLANASVH